MKHLPHWCQTLCIAILVAVILPGCYATNYRVPAGTPNFVRMGPKKPTEKYQRQVFTSVKEHHFLFGLIPYERERNVVAVANLQRDEALVNAQITRELSATDVIITILGAALTAGLLPVVWQMHTTTISGDVVKLNKAGATKAPPPEEEDDDEEMDEEVEPEAKPTGASNDDFKVETSPETHAAAQKFCTDQGMKLPTRKQVLALRSELDSDLDVWSSEVNGDSAWYVSVQSGASFLESRLEKLEILCVK